MQISVEGESGGEEKQSGAQKHLSQSHFSKTQYILAHLWWARVVISSELQVDSSSGLGYSRKLQWHTMNSCSYHTDYSIANSVAIKRIV